MAADQAKRELDAEDELDRVKIKKASENPELADRLQAIRDQKEVTLGKFK